MIIAYPHVTTDAEVAGGRPCVEDTGVRVTEVVAAVEACSKLADVQTQFSSRPLTLGEVYAALAFYHDNAVEMEEYRVADETAAADSERERLAAIKRHFMGEE
jgi:uncharacterized protein (DUF433 family)